MALGGSVVLIYQDWLYGIGWLCGADYIRPALWCWFTKTDHTTLGGSVVLIYQNWLYGSGWLCGADYTRPALWCWLTETGHMALYGSEVLIYQDWPYGPGWFVLLITLDRFCGADLPRLAIWP